MLQAYIAGQEYKGPQQSATAAVYRAASQASQAPTKHSLETPFGREAHKSFSCMVCFSAYCCSCNCRCKCRRDFAVFCYRGRLCGIVRWHLAGLDFIHRLCKEDHVLFCCCKARKPYIITPTRLQTHKLKLQVHAITAEWTERCQRGSGARQLSSQQEWAGRCPDVLAVLSIWSCL